MLQSVRLTLVAVLTVVLCCVPIEAEPTNSDVVSYRGYQVFEIQTKSQSDLDVLVLFTDSVDYWKLPRIVGANATACVEPSWVNHFKQTLWQNNITFSTLIVDLGEVFDIEESVKQRYGRSTKRSRSISFDSYARHGQINLYLDDLAARYPNLVKVESRSVTPEYRRIKYIRISNSARGAAKNRTIFIDAGIHAREWIAPATALYAINQLVENAARNQDLLDKFDWVVLPLANPDGYEYSHTRDRLWRKTRSQSSICNGVDGNRNFDFKWGVVGASTWQCSDVFQGASAFSEVETRTMRDIMEEVRSTCKFYLTLHSYGPFLLYPWGYTSELPSTWLDLDEVARAGANAIKSSTGTAYAVGSSTNVLYAASGASDDYAFAAKKIPISITMELPGGGVFGFDLPASRIRAVVAESWTGIRAMALKVSDKY